MIATDGLMDIDTAVPAGALDARLIQFLLTGFCILSRRKLCCVRTLIELCAGFPIVERYVVHRAMATVACSADEDVTRWIM
jgi:hypothetical protein